MRVIKVRSVHSIHSQWKSKQMLATYMPRMRNNNLEIRIAGSSCRPVITLQSFYLLIKFSWFAKFTTWVWRLSFAVSDSESLPVKVAP